MRSVRFGAATLTVLIVVLAGASATTQEPDPPRKFGFDPEASLWSRYQSSVVPDEDISGDPDALAAEFGLEPVEPGSDGIRRWRHPLVDMVFVYIPGGPFLMGSNHSDIFQNNQVLEAARKGKVKELYFSYERPQQEIWVSPYFIGAYEVTVAEYRAFLELARKGELREHDFPLTPQNFDHTPFMWDQSEDFSGDRQPVAGLTWLSGMAFSSWLGGRLPTEAEWEKAARGQDGRLFPWGNRFDPMRANTSESLNRRPTPVGTYEGGRSPYGCYDMAGNVFEYTIDAWEDTRYRHLARRDPGLLVRKPTTRAPYCTVRGGSWNSKSLLHLARVTSRGKMGVQPRFSPGPSPLEYLHMGFRVVLSPLRNLYPESWWNDKVRAQKQRNQAAGDGGNDAAADDG